MTIEFEYPFEDLEIAPGIMVAGIAEIVQINGRFELTGLHTGWRAEPPFHCHTNDSSEIWVWTQEALLRESDKLQDAADRQEERDRTAWEEGYRYAS